MSENFNEYIYWAGHCATFAFAVTAVLAGRQNLLMTKELYAIPVFLGCTLYVALAQYFPGNELWHMFICFGIAFGLRAASIRWKLQVPEWLSTKIIN